MREDFGSVVVQKKYSPRPRKSAEGVDRRRRAQTRGRENLRLIAGDCRAREPAGLAGDSRLRFGAHRDLVNSEALFHRKHSTVQPNEEQLFGLRREVKFRYAVIGFQGLNLPRNISFQAISDSNPLSCEQARS
jgi:hypothetical protein